MKCEIHDIELFEGEECIACLRKKATEDNIRKNSEFVDKRKIKKKLSS